MKLENTKPDDIKMHIVLLALASFGDQRMWPFILMHDCEFELSVWQFYNKHGRLPSFEELHSDETKQLYKTLVGKLRGYVQSLFDNMVEEERLKEIGERLEKDKLERKQRWQERENEKQRLQKVGKDFIEGNKVDYGGKTVAQLAEELGISKSEVRRRKQAGTL